MLWLADRFPWAICNQKKKRKKYWIYFVFFFVAFEWKRIENTVLFAVFYFPGFCSTTPSTKTDLRGPSISFLFSVFFSLDLFFCLPPRLCRFLGFFFFLVVVLSKVGSVIGFISLNRLLLREIVFFSFFFFFLFFLVKAILVLSIRGPWISSIVLKWMDKEWIVLVLEMILLIVCKKGTLSP